MSISFGNNPSPSDVTLYLDQLTTQTLPKYKKKMTDQIGATNAILNKIMNSGNYVPEDGGLYIQEPLMYALTQGNWYGPNDELGMAPTDGVTGAQFVWSNIATPIVYDMPTILKNRGSEAKIIDMVKTKITQAEMGIQEDFSRAFMFGNVPNGGLLSDNLVDSVTLNTAIDPLAKIIAYNSSTLTVGNIAESSNAWWRNRSRTSSATTYLGFLGEMMNMFNLCSAGTGGSPDLILCDQITWENFIKAYYANFKKDPDSSDSFPGKGRKWMGADVVWDDKMPDVFSGTIPDLSTGVGDANTLTYGTMYFINTKFLKIRYMPGRDFEMLQDESGKSFFKPVNGDSRIGHIAWMGNVTINQRRKQGVIAKIARSLT